MIDPKWFEQRGKLADPQAITQRTMECFLATCNKSSHFLVVSSNYTMEDLENQTMTAIFCLGHKTTFKRFDQENVNVWDTEKF